ncbi:MAG: hypothetical protein H5T86_03090 [Armatimonadetes bacterium]|nr:hypothetical protein [Armatimonadota bacterium]
MELAVRNDKEEIYRGAADIALAMTEEGIQVCAPGWTAAQARIVARGPSAVLVVGPDVRAFVDGLSVTGGVFELRPGRRRIRLGSQRFDVEVIPDRIRTEPYCPERHPEECPVHHGPTGQTVRVCPRCGLAACAECFGATCPACGFADEE